MIANHSLWENDTDTDNKITFISSYDKGFNGDGRNDVYYGTGLNQNLYGHAGNDQRYGDPDSDYLSGGTGNDLLKGGVEAISSMLAKVMTLCSVVWIMI